MSVWCKIRAVVSYFTKLQLVDGGMSDVTVTINRRIVQCRFGDNRSAPILCIASHKLNWKLRMRTMSGQVTVTFRHITLRELCLAALRLITNKFL